MTALDRARVGERWVLRTRLPDGSATDVTGWLTAVEHGFVDLELVGRAAHRIARDSVVVAKRVPTARGGPDPRRTSADELERAALPGWVALSEPLGAWTLRAGGGFTGRANSTLAVGDPGMALVDAAERVIGYAYEHGIAPRTQVIVGSEEDAGLVALGWRPVYVTTDVLACRLTMLVGDGLPDDRVLVEEVLSDAWWRAYARSRPNDADAAILRMILDGHPPRALAGVRGRGEDLAAIARGHVSGAWLGIAAVWTEPARRRQGLATAMMRALGHWAARRGARYAYLQVAQENGDAHAAYGRLGFAVHHSYRYLQAPASHLRGRRAAAPDPRR